MAMATRTRKNSGLLAALLLAAIPGCGPDPGSAETSPSKGASPPAKHAPAIFHPDPEHAWNRVYRAVYLRRAADGRYYGQGEIDPLLWPDSRHFLEADSRDQAVRALDDFLARGAQSEIRDPVKRAVLQHDLWAVFDWLASRPPEEQAALQPLLARLARVLQRLALSREEIEALPDNYAAAVAARQFPEQFHPVDRKLAFLPPGLLDDAGPWVPMASFARSTTPLHFDFVGGRSLFLVVLRLPGGRAATLAYAEQLRQAGESQPPQFPVGTQVALVRRMMVYDTEGRLTPTRLTETVQLRVYRAVRPGERRAVQQAAEDQDFFEFEMNRARLFAGQAGGLQPIARDQRRLMTFGVSQHMVNKDPFRSSSPEALAGSSVFHSCPICHAGNGINSVLSLRSRGTYTSTTAGEASRTAWLKGQRFDWGLLRGMWLAKDAGHER